jgi:hypothetical protein
LDSTMLKVTSKRRMGSRRVSAEPAHCYSER